MTWFGSCLMFTVAASWIAAAHRRRRAGESLEWLLLSILPAAASLLVFLSAGDTAAALRLWLAHLTLAALVTGASLLRLRTRLPRPLPLNRYGWQP